MNDYEAHLSSYDHSHKQRMKDMKAMVRDPNAAARARRQEAKADGVISIKLGDAVAGAAGSGSTSGGAGAGAGAGASAGGGGFKKGGFKKTGFKAAFAPVGPAAVGEEAKGKGVGDSKAQEGLVREVKPVVRSELVESDTEDEGYEVYDPRFPTD